MFLILIGCLGCKEILLLQYLIHLDPFCAPFDSLYFRVCGYYIVIKALGIEGRSKTWGGDPRKIRDKMHIGIVLSFSELCSPERALSSALESSANVASS